MDWCKCYVRIVEPPRTTEFRRQRECEVYGWLNDAALPRIEDKEIGPADSRLLPRLGEIGDGVVATFVRQAKRAPVHCDAVARARLAVELHRLRGVHVHGRHKPPRLVSTNWNQRQIGCPT